ncbi:MAG TPA: exopolysaccharide biosynthesis polyprenyl glycosylphosphotransferase [Candidatus Acidoferrales bacterium]|nr:exopolysaccharide biosynthesis polyprenyl glycosylphosphotransferase [Candidatus Acidoferrales bacterium]
MHPSLRSVYLLRVIIDLLVLVIAFTIAVFGAICFSHAELAFEHLTNFCVGLLAIWVITAGPAHVYDDFRSRSLAVEILTVLKNCFAQVIALVFLLFFSKETLLSRAFVLSYGVVIVIMLSTEKIAIRGILKRIRKHGKNMRNLLIIGAGHIGRGFADNVHENPFLGYNVVGFVDDNRKDQLNGRYLGPLSELGSILRQKKIDDIVVALPASAHQKIIECIQAGATFGKRVRIIPNFIKQSPLRYYESSMIGGFPVIGVGTVPLDQVHLRIVKRLFDLIVSSFVILFVLIWLIPLIYALQKIFSPGSVFFAQARIGRGGKIFKCFKFRSMHEINSNHANFTPTSQSDGRVTRLGRILRKTNLDEMPQFINVFSGSMSIVGPRAHPVCFHNEYIQYVEHIRLRNLVKPGITGWAQVNGLRGDSPNREENKKKILERVEYDLWYIENWSFWLDVWIMLKTIWRTIVGDPKAC